MPHVHRRLTLARWTDRLDDSHADHLRTYGAVRLGDLRPGGRCRRVVAEVPLVLLDRRRRAAHGRRERDDLVDRRRRVRRRDDDAWRLARQDRDGRRDAFGEAARLGGDRAHVERARLVVRMLHGRRSAQRAE